MSQTAPYPPETLNQYALVADGERGALIGPRGDIAFLCAPRWHSPAVFSSLVGGAGHYAVTPSGSRYVWGGHYEPSSLIWRSRWVTGDAVIECREALAFPGDPHRLVLLRRIEAVQGDARVTVVLDPRAGFGCHASALHRIEAGLWTGETGDLRVRWQTGPGNLAGNPRPDRGGFSRSGSAIVGELHIRAGECHDLVLEISDEPLPWALPEPEAAWDATEAAWRAQHPRLATSLADDDVTHSYAVLRGLTSRDNGMVAAATMALPEHAEAGRNYDYRYAWIRDQCYTGQAAIVANADPLIGSALGFVTARLLEDGPHLKPAYTVAGDAVPDETSVDLPGYPGGADKVGNHVNAQFQLDAFGEALLLFAAAVRHGASTPDQHHAALLAGRTIAQRWREPDAGIWELDNQPWAHSRLTCAAGLRAYAAAWPGPETHDWSALADVIVAETSRTSVHPTGRWQRAPRDDRVDAALLLPAIRGAVSPEDPRSRATLRAVQSELSDEGFVFRFRQGPGQLNDWEGAFLLSGFHMALATHQIGDPLAAVRWFERNRSAIGPPGLFTEEFDVVQRQQRGNLPQAFVHALLMETAVTLTAAPDQSDRGARTRRPVRRETATSAARPPPGQP
ncbi:glycoside hydrolase family 15 protein [Nocardioides panacis]|uniref:Glycoside hydrolase family 15 protein n=1 Tax=Nocardioides panacis TaxID=2849501 RepID=A0A975Y1N9_9ACTN|nr:glycoside hydrolase family 15 protein [Nocardioides panacis]QWZ09710.1 glycoside hydrolase family 15 protein [Nocardioides panacis]